VLLFLGKEFSQPTFSRGLTGLNISCQLLPELKIDMLKTSIGSWFRLRRWNILRQRRVRPCCEIFIFLE